MSTTVFRYRAADRFGATEAGRIVAASREAAHSALARRGLFALSLDAQSAAHHELRSMPAADLAIGLRILATLLGAGMTAGRALSAMDEMAPPRWRAAIPEVLDHVRQGRSLAGALREAGVGVPRAVLGVIEAGEAGSGLARALERAAELAERDAAMRAALRSALAYPALLAVAGFASIGVLVGVVIPRFAAILAELGQALPPATRLVLEAASVGRAAALPGAIAITIGAVAWLAWVRTERGLAAWHSLLLGLPAIGRVRRAAASARVSVAMAALLENGVTIAAALPAAARAAGDAALGARLARARERVVQGARLSTALEAEAALTPTTVRLVRAGEEGGAVAGMFARAAAIEADAAERAVRGAVRLLEPAMILAFGGIVALVAAALLQAVYTVRPGA